MNLDPQPDLQALADRGVIDRLLFQEGETFQPEGSVDIFVSTYGSLSYVDTTIRRDYFLQHAYALSKGGRMFIALTIPETNLSAFMRKMQGVMQALKKRGFNASFRELKSNTGPPYALVIQRFR